MKTPMTLPHAKQTFAELMQESRKRKLTTKELMMLSIARQTMRMFRKPVSNRPIGKGIKARDKSRLKERDNFVHHGYYVQEMISGEYVISKDGVHISYAKSKDEAKRIIDGLVNPRAKSNPAKPVLIYGKVKRIEAVKSQNHICDAECKACGHRYFHEFTSNPKMYGLPDGSLLIKV